MAGLYIHIPFCHSKCAYCDFYSIRCNGDVSAYVTALGEELRLRRHEIDEIETVYIGGGTPSILGDDDFRRLASIVRGELPGGNFLSVKEFTLEVNPEDVTKEKAAMWRDCGVNRVSMGVQTFVDDQLDLIGRRHTAQQAVDAYLTLSASGFTNISLDLIYSLPGQTLQSWKESLGNLLSLRPEHFSAYILSYEPRTRLSSMLKAGKIEASDESTVEQMYQHLIKAAAAAGYEHYEISNFCLSGYRAVHNSRYWDSTPYLGLGPSAHSFDGRTRRINPSDVKAYIEALGSGRTVCEVDDENDDNRFNDLLFTALRTSDGLDFARIPRRRRCRFLCDVLQFVESGKVEHADTRFFIPESHWLTSDYIISSLMQVSD